MSTLHLIHVNLQMRPELRQQLQQSLSANDALLFLAEGIYSIATPALSYPQPIYVLMSDLQRTGLVVKDSNIHVIHYDEFVALGVRYERSLSWN